MKFFRSNLEIVFRSGLIGDTLVCLPALSLLKSKSGSKILYISLKESKYHIVPQDIIGGFDLIDYYLPLRYYNKGLFLIDIFKVVKFVFCFNCKNVFHLETFEFNYKLKKFFFYSLGIKNFYFEKSYCNNKISIRLVDIIRQKYVSDFNSNFKLSPRLSSSDRFESYSNSIKGVNYYVVGACTNFKSKLWDKDNFIYICLNLYKRFQLVPVFYGSKADYDYCNLILNEVGVGLNLAGSFDITESLMFFKKSKFYLGNDTGVMHMGSMMGVTCFTIFSSIEKDNKWLPYGNNHFNFKSKVICEGCKLKECIEFNNLCTKLILKEDVLNEISNYIERTA
ncbi:glycosyltransferase family 9 protein [Aquirufa lenticrescens]|uniref:glycosyltransferase family 9 protein n=1 Tax=Aquirufa lenticrescens TaxID=2696560 RepID=UPI001CAA76E6|nr:glycosyltransferase family 9 protein [Aquirufa lenticrescens]UAJ14219.1 glycosyltransferase family 9 protein [Aquirufa lenticrescens]